MSSSIGQCTASPEGTEDNLMDIGSETHGRTGCPPVVASDATHGIGPAGVLLMQSPDGSSSSECGSASSDSSDPSTNSSQKDQVELFILLERVPVDANNSFTSIGSIHHPKQCNPCIFHAMCRACELGVRCSFCHFRHDSVFAKRRMALRKVGKVSVAGEVASALPMTHSTHPGRLLVPCL
ncbi:unnamed protein product [Polarella glacialis]|uniref:C3H1-type domain-containing protein n=1 Tax=Polarella glacialis TaxID=89957 RepID=A0A813GFU0_POLGL|nr:unnamed protein product [Polarella glacialis]